MRFRVTLQHVGHERRIPINYAYPISSWIYRVIYGVDSKFAEWLHSSGYSNDNKRFKLFTFSNLLINRKKIEGDRLVVLSPEVHLILSFFPEAIIEKFIIGVFQDQLCVIGDRKSRVHFRVANIERLPDVRLGDENVFRCLSPICIARTVPWRDKKSAEYVHPEDPGFGKLLFENLLSKYETVEQKESLRSLQTEQFIAADAMEFEVLSTPRSRLVKIKAGTPEETLVRGYFFRFRLKAPYALLELGYHTGFGIKNSMGFGCVEWVG